MAHFCILRIANYGLVPLCQLIFGSLLIVACNLADVSAQETDVRPPDEAQKTKKPSPPSNAESRLSLTDEDTDVFAGDKHFGHDPNELDVVVVTGSRMEENLSDAVTQVEVITRTQIEATPAENAADILEEQHGVQVNRSFNGAGVRIQGFDNKHILILIDGERQAGRIAGVIDLTRIPADLIEQIEIVKGPSSSLYGSDAMGGVINIITRREDAQEPRVSLRGSYGSRSAIDVNGDVSARFGILSSRLLLSFNRQDAYDWDPSDIATSGSAYDRFTANYKTSLLLSKKLKIDGRAEYTYIDLQGVDSSNPKLVFDRRNLRETALVSLKPKLKFNARSSLDGFISHQIFRDQFVYDQRGSVTKDKNEETQEGLSQAGISFNNTLGYHIINVGGEVLYQQLTADRLSQDQSTRWRGSIYAQDEWLVLTEIPLSLVSGLRLDADSQFGHFTSPKLALRFDPHPTFIARLSYGMGYRAPVFKELYLFFENPSVGYLVEGNPDLKPETSQSLNIGFEASLFPLVRLTFNGFYHDVNQLISYDLKGLESGTSRYSYVNIDEVIHQGVEVGALLLLPLNLGLGAGYVLTSSRDRDEDRQLPGRALHQGTAELKYHNKDHASLASVSVTWSASRPFYLDTDGDGRDDETLSADPFATVDVRFKQGIGKHIRLFVNLENILNEGDHRFLAVQPFTVSAGISMYNR